MITFWFIVSVFIVISSSLCFLAYLLLDIRPKQYKFKVDWILKDDVSINLFYVKNNKSFLSDKGIKYIHSIIKQEVKNCRFILDYEIRLSEIELACFLRDNESEFIDLLNDFKHLRFDQDKVDRFLNQSSFTNNQFYIRAIMESILKQIFNEKVLEIIRK